jgi:hypothetical protein
MKDEAARQGRLATTDSLARIVPPALVIELAVEAEPRAYITATSEAEAAGLRDWLVTHQNAIQERVDAILDTVDQIRSKPEVDG